MSAGVAEVIPKYLAEAVSNAVPLGYKHTDVGVIPDDWDVSPLSTMTSLMTNGFVGTAKTHYTDSHDGVTYIQGYNVEENSFNFNGIKRVTPEFHKKNSKSCLREGDVLMVQTGDVGLVTIVPQELEGANCHALIISRFKKETCDPHYFSCYLNSQQGRLRLKELETGTTMKHINVGDLLHFEVPYPRAKHEQTAIANALSDVDALISELEKLIAKKQAIKTATMQQLLTGRTRLPQFALRQDGTPKGTKPSELGEVPEDWGVVTLAHLATVKSGGTPSTLNKDFWDGEIHWCTPTDITALDGKKYLATTTRKITEAGVAKSAAELLPVGTVVMTSRATIGECAVTTSEMTTNQGFKNFICGPELDNEFLFYLLGSLKDRFLALCSGSTFLEISTSQVRNFSVVAPDKSEQTAIATILSDMDEEIQALEQRLGKTRQIKQGMMQELLTGKTRLIKGEAHG
ncbi:restriction endonuclease subunit S [Shewanella fodinae]|uniref:Type I restriction enzyme S subunit n=1 Tax=Shewanella fodinae TaxID=552357 RepID=A0A4R2FGQ7_9GAMM|nr:restriction endonuclease subunit S [Shewanella fodinae]TCN86839.1 type I restriction enzyme S subunit [Shewanella fodinae]